MGFFRRRELEYAAAVAEATFYPGSGTNGTGATAVRFRGEDAAIVHIPALYLDEVLLRDRKRDASRLLDTVEGFVAGARIRVQDDPPAALSYAVPLVEEWRGKPLAVVTTAIRPAFQAHTTFKRRLAATKVIHLAFWAYWDSVVRLFLSYPQDIAALLDNLAEQCAYYRLHGFKMRYLGRAAAYASMRGASDRLADEIGALAGITGEEFRDLPEEERDRLIAAHTRRSVEAFPKAEDERLWAGRASAQFQEAFYERLAEAKEAESETFVRSGAYSDATDLDLSGPETTDADLARFPEMSGLVDLDLSSSRITDAGLAHLARLQSLDLLDLSDTGITGEGLVHVAGLPITRLLLEGTRIDDRALRHLAALGNLELLDLSGTAVTEDGLAHLLKVSSLHDLRVSDTRISDKDVLRLLDHPNLAVVEARRTRVTEKAVRAWLDHKRVLITESEEEEARVEEEMAQQFAEYTFKQTAERFKDIYFENSNPALTGDLDEALERMAQALGYIREPDDSDGLTVWSVGSAGYVWRSAEQRTGFVNDRVRQAAEEAVEPGQERAVALAAAAAMCLERGVPLGLGSPGGLMWGREFLEQAFGRIASALPPPGSRIPDSDLRYAFYFGVALRDVETVVDELRK